MEKFSFEIATPCHENWENMRPETQGRFCASCQKCVVDLSDKKPAEVKALYDAHKGDMCGRVRLSQLARKPRRIFPKIQFPVSALARVQRFALALLLVGGLIFGLPGKASAQAPDAPEPVKMGMMVYVPTNVVQGVVLDEDGKAMPNVRVWLMDEEGNRIVSTDANAAGEYRFEGEWFGNFKLQAAVPGYDGGEATITFGRGTDLITNLVLQEMRAMGGMGVIGYHVEEQEEWTKRDQRISERKYRRAVRKGEVVEDEDDFGSIQPIDEDDDAEYLEEQPVKTGNEGHYEDTWEAGMLTYLRQDSMLKSLRLVIPDETEASQDSLVLPDQLAEAGVNTLLELDGFQYTVYPNPSQDRVFLTAGSNTAEDLKIQLYDLEGRLLQELSWSPGIQTVQVMDIGTLANGTYLLSLTGANAKQQYARIVKQ